MASEHICEVCNRPVSEHPLRDRDGVLHWIPPCCPGCPCGSAPASGEEGDSGAFGWAGRDDEVAELNRALTAAREEAGRLWEALEGWPDKLLEVIGWLDVLDLALDSMTLEKDRDRWQRDLTEFADTLRTALAREDGG